MKREELLKELWNEQDIAFELMTKYDSLPHYYGQDVLYQAEAYMIHEIGNNPGITATELAACLNKTLSACSQMIKKLINKGLITQVRDENSRRVFHLNLTEDGKRVYKDHVDFNEECKMNTFSVLEAVTEEELAIHIKVQRILNKVYQGDVDKSIEKYAKENQ